MWPDIVKPIRNCEAIEFQGDMIHVRESKNGEGRYVPKRLDITVPARVLSLGLTVVLSSSCGRCGNDEVVRVPSPDAKFEAVVFQRDCGATTGFSTQVSVVTKGASLPNEAGNVFIADTDHGKAQAQVGAVHRST